jgi:DNA-binding MarR family transcriptional regulator
MMDRFMAPKATADSTQDGDTEITLGLLNAVQENSAVTQRTMASELGIALGLANTYLKRCVRKGLIKVSQIPPNRYAYYLTPKGFSEKSRLTTEYLSSSFTFFRRARGQCGDLLEYCAARNWPRIALAGSSELAEIATLCAIERNIRLVGLIDTGQVAAPGRKGDPKPAEFAGLKVVSLSRKFADLDAIIVTDLQIPQAVFDRLATEFAAERILTPPLLRILRETPPAESAS